MQCIQPLPHSGNLTELDFHDHSAIESNSTRTATHSADSPLPELKKKRRKRTLTEHSPHTTLVPRQQCTSTPLPLSEAELSVYVTSTHASVSMADFRSSVEEKESLNGLQEDVFQCMIHKLYRCKQSDTFFPSLQSFVNCIRKQTADSEQSKLMWYISKSLVKSKFHFT